MSLIRHPQNLREIAERDYLLQKMLRPFPTQYKIASEYPTVLNKNDVRFSWGLYSDEHQLIAHANLWPRVLKDRANATEVQVGLIGNVATDDKFSGRGHMSLLLEHLADRAKDAGLQALILWSDLTEFYQKRGFSSCGVEWRYLFRTQNLEKALRSLPQKTTFKRKSARKFDPMILTQHRYPTQVTLERSLEMCRSQLSTVGLSIFCSNDPESRSPSFVCVGKGCDLQAVVHEWGASDPLILLQGILAIGREERFHEVILLSPSDLKDDWGEVLGHYAEKIEQHPMALARCLTLDQDVSTLLGKAFVWGLDSI